MRASELAKQEGKEAILEKIQKSGLVEYGIFPENMADKIRRAGHYPRVNANPRHDKPLAAAGALDNEDTEHMLLHVAREYPEKILEGLNILAFLTDASEMYLYVPEGEIALKKALTAKANEIGLKVQVEEGIADVRRLRGGIISHFVTLAALSDLAEDCYRPKACVCVKTITAKGVSYTKPEFIPYGTEIRSLIPKETPPIKAVKSGGHLYTPSILDTKITETTAPSDGVIALYAADCCMVKAAEEHLKEKRKAGCGKCTFCREGIHQLYTRIHEITAGKGDITSPEIIKEIGEAMPGSTQCSLGQTGALFTIDTLELFADEYEQHIKRKKCPTGQCTAYINVYIEPGKCTGCGKCIPACPINCVEGLPGYIHMIEDIDCTKCGKCMTVCSEQAIVRTKERVPAIPDRLTRVGRYKKY